MLLRWVIHVVCDFFWIFSDTHTCWLNPLVLNPDPSVTAFLNSTVGRGCLFTEPSPLRLASFVRQAYGRDVSS